MIIVLTVIFVHLESLADEDQKWKHQKQDKQH